MKRKQNLITAFKHYSQSTGEHLEDNAIHVVKKLCKDTEVVIIRRHNSKIWTVP